MDGTLGEKTAPDKGVLPDAPEVAARMSCRNINVYYGEKQAIYDVSLQIADRSVTALIGPSGCGKSTFLRCLNRMNDTIEGCRVEGEILMEGENINSPSIDPVLLRSRVGMVFQKPAGRPGRDRREKPASGGLVGRGEGSPQCCGHQPFWRSAAASLYRPRHCCASGSHPDGRAVFGA